MAQPEYDESKIEKAHIGGRIVILKNKLIFWVDRNCV